MRLPILIITAFCAGLGHANIIFPKIQPACDPNILAYSGCLRGQICYDDGSCVAILDVRDSVTGPRDDGRCGSNYDGATCDPAGPYGGCCSSYGWCGNTTDHCLIVNGCQSGCTSAPTSISSDASAATSTQEPVISAATVSSSPASVPTGAATIDGTCGAGNGGTVCGDWSQGSCCSMYGFCGNTTAHCGEGCQSGPCLQGAVVPAPSASPAPANPNPDWLNIIGESGVPAMHAALLPNGRVMFLDKVENYTQLTLADGQYAYSAEYDPDTNTVVGLQYKTNAFCSGGSFLANGTIVSVGGNAPLSFIDPTVGDGFRGIRYLTRSANDDSLNGQDWVEPGNMLDTARWYASVQTMPDGTLFVASGSLNGLDPTVPANNNPTYEILDAQGISSGLSIPMEILVKTQPYYMYPFIHLLPNGNLFVFVSKSSEIFDVAANQTVTSFPDLVGDYRTYPNTGGSVMLPLSSANGYNPEVLVCGGGAYQDITSPTDASCGRIAPLSAAPAWELDSMPTGRVMCEGMLLPDGTVLFLNGAEQGAQGFGLATDPTLQSLIYDPAATLGERWSTAASSTIPRLYHSVALLLLDGTVLVAGSNPVQMPILTADAENPFVTEFRVERFVPPYLAGANADKRPTDVQLSTTTLTTDTSGTTFGIIFTATVGSDPSEVSIVLYHGGFVTHSLHMGHRMVLLDFVGFIAGAAQQSLTVSMPVNASVAPPGPYVVYVVVDGIPAVGQFVMVV